MHISRDVKEIRQNDIINDDVIEKWKIVKIQIFLAHSRENLPGNKKYYYEKVWKSFKEAKIDIFDFCLWKVGA